LAKKAASPLHGRFNRIRLVAPMCTPSNTYFLGPTRVHRPILNGIFIDSAVFAGLTIVTDSQTDRPRYSVCNDRPHRTVHITH